MPSRAAVLEAPGKITVQEFDLPEVGEDDALLKVEACGLCGTDHEQFTGALPAQVPMIPGHETVGVIEKIGPVAAERWGVGAGERVAVEVFQSCRECRPCLEGNYRNCRAHGLKDMYGATSTRVPPSLWGGYAEYQYLSPDTLLHKVPESLTPEVATIFNPLGAGIRWGVTVPGTTEGDVVVIMGPGIRGLSAAAAVREAGAGFVMVTGVGPADDERLRLAIEAFGADLSVDVNSADPSDALKKATGGLADVVIDVTARAPKALAQSIGLARPGGTIVVAGTRGSAETPGFWPDMIVFKEVTIKGALGVDSTAYAAALELIASNKYPFADLPRAIADLDTVSELLEVMAGNGSSPPPVHGVLVP